MASRHWDWYNQAVDDVSHARISLEAGHFAWACFAAHQAAEKAVKAVIQKFGGVAWGHSILGLLRNLPSEVQVDSELEERAKELDRHYIPSRYPNAHQEGAPFQVYTRREAEDAIRKAEQILRFCESRLS